MSPQLHETRSSLPATGLAACVLGLAVLPFIFAVAIGSVVIFRAPGSVEPAFWLVMLVSLICSGYLLYRFLSKPREQDRTQIVKILGWFMEALSWLVTASFVLLASFYPLNTTFERVCVSITYFLLASLLSLPIVLMRKTTLLQRRLMQLPKSVATSALVLIVSISAAMVVIFLQTAPAFFH